MCDKMKELNMKTTKLATLALLTVLAPAAWAESVIEVASVKAFATAPTAMAGGGFMEITNSGSTDDQLIDVIADYPRVEIHTTEFDSEGIAKMMHLDDGITIPAGETVALEPDGLHVMFMELRDTPFVEGENVDATLVFENAGEIPVTFDIVKREMNHNH